MPATHTDWTVEMLDALPDDGQRYEIIDGELFVTPSPSRRNRVQPDIFVVRVVNGKRPVYPFDLTDLLLAIEVVSPGNPRYDHQTKRALDLKSGIPEYWIVNPDARTVMRWTHVEDPGEVLSERIVWQPNGMATPLIVELPGFFDDALG